MKEMEKLIDSWGLPEEIFTDNGREFVNNQFNEFCNKNNIKVKHGSPFTPSTQGVVERLNGTIIGKLRKISEFNENLWPKYLKEAVNAYNRCFHRSIGCAPLELYGKKSL